MSEDRELTEEQLALHVGVNTVLITGRSKTDEPFREWGRFTCNPKTSNDSGFDWGQSPKDLKNVTDDRESIFYLLIHPAARDLGTWRFAPSKKPSFQVLAAILGLFALETFPTVLPFWLTTSVALGLAGWLLHSFLGGLRKSGMYSIKAAGELGSKSSRKNLMEAAFATQELWPKSDVRVDFRRDRLLVTLRPFENTLQSQEQFVEIVRRIDDIWTATLPD
jgi:hypothetical protein